MTHTKTHILRLSILWVIFCVCQCTAVRAESTPEAPPIPPGYANEGQIRLAILTGLLKLIDALASPITHLTKDDPPTLILHGTIDAIVPIAQADSLAERLRELSIPVVYERFPGWPHTMDLAQIVNERCCYVMDRFLEEHLPLPKQ